MTHKERLERLEGLKAGKTKQGQALSQLKAAPKLDKSKAKIADVVELLEKVIQIWD